MASVLNADTRKVKPLALAGTHVRQHKRRQEHCRDPNWEVHQKDHTPAKAEQVSMDEDAPKDICGRVRDD
jgi:hypothetical protein